MNVEIGAEAALFPEKEYINPLHCRVHNWCVVLAAYVFVVYVFSMTGHVPVCAIHLCVM
jgi:hypothetical protein